MNTIPFIISTLTNTFLAGPAGDAVSAEASSIAVQPAVAVAVGFTCILFAALSIVPLLVKDDGADSPYP